MGRKGKMELQMEDEEAATGGGETEPTASFEIDLDDSNINVGKKKGSRGAPSSRASGGVAPPMSPDMPSVSPQMSTRTKVPRGMVLAPKWSRIAHYGVHAFMLLLIIILTLVLVLVELDAKDGGDDGVANRILKPFKLNLDGVVVSNDRARVCEQQYTSNPRGGSSSASDASNNGYVQAALMYHQVLDNSEQDLDILDDLIGEDAVFLASDGSGRNWEEFKESTKRWRGIYNQDRVTEMSGFAMSSYEAVVQVQSKNKDTNDVEFSYFATSLFDPQTGKIIRHAWYPSLSFSVDRVEIVKLLLDILDWSRYPFLEAYADDKEYEKKLKLLDDILSEDIKYTLNGATIASGIDTYKKIYRQRREQAKNGKYETYTTRELYSTRSFVIDRYETFATGESWDDSYEDNYMIMAGYADWQFDRKNRIVEQHTYQTDFLTKRGENAIKFHQILNDAVSTKLTRNEKMASVQGLFSILDLQNFSMMDSNGRVFTLAQMRDIVSAEDPQMRKYVAGFLSSDMYTTVEFDNAVYVMWHNDNSGTPVAIHHFAPGSSVIVNTYFTPVFYRETANGEIYDIYNREKAMIDTALSDFYNDNFDINAYFTDDFVGYTHYGGKQDAESLMATATDYFAKFIGSYDASANLTRTTLSRSANQFSVVEHGQWTTTDENKQENQVSSFLDIWYFDAFAENLEDRKIQTVYVYNSTANMIF